MTEKYIAGKTNQLTIDHFEAQGAYLKDGTGSQVLLPTKWIPARSKEGDLIEVFIYFDSDDRPIATTTKPFAQLNEIAYLEAADVNSTGAFLNWGLEKQLLVPYREQKAKMIEGKKYLVYLFADPQSGRIAASAKIERFIDKTPPEYTEGQEVEIILWEKTDLGYKAIINSSHQGLLYENEVFEKMQKGLKRTAYISKLREDGKIDLRLLKPGYDKVEDLAQKIVHELQKNRGFLPLNDKSDAEDVYDILEMSKKNFKKAIGLLYKNKQIRFGDDGVYLIK
jgi:predicted RNA-binding protein (virulence factor B family)